MPNNKAKGDYGERISVKELIKAGYTVLDTNYRGSLGEIDIIAKKFGYTVFIEVKLRKGIGKGFPKEAVNKRKQDRIIATAQEYICEKQLFNNDFRFDVIEILIENEKLLFNHIENAFWESD